MSAASSVSLDSRPHTRSHQSKRLPSTRVNIRLQLPANESLDPMSKPHLPHQLVIPLLIQEQLMVPPQRRIRLAMTIKVRRVRKAAAHWLVQEEHHALADVDEDADSPAAFLHVLPAAAALAVVGAFHAAGCLGAEDGGAEEADGRVGDFFAGCGAFALDGFFGQGVVVFGQADELVDGGVGELDVDWVVLVFDSSVCLGDPAVREVVELLACGRFAGE